VNIRYPREIFVREVRHGVSVWISHHKGLLKYIERHAQMAERWLTNGNLEELAVATFATSTKSAIDIFRFSVSTVAEQDQASVSSSFVPLSLFQSFFEKLHWKVLPELQNSEPLSFNLFLKCRGLAANDYTNEWLEEDESWPRLELGKSQVRVLDSILTAELASMPNSSTVPSKVQQLDVFVESTVPQASILQASSQSQSDNEGFEYTQASLGT